MQEAKIKFQASVLSFLVMSAPNGTFPAAEAAVFPTEKHPAVQEITLVNLEPTPLNQDNRMVSIGDVKNSSGRKRVSDVWNDFTKIREGKNVVWAICNHCEERFDGSSKSGTTHLRNHLKSDRCKSKRNRGESDDCLTIKKGKSKIGDGQELNNELNKIGEIIKYYGSSLKSIKDDILTVFEKEKEKLKKYFYELPCRFNLFVEKTGWKDGYAFVSIHFIDDNWKVQKKFINFISLEDRYGKLMSPLKVLNLDKDILSIVIEMAEDDRNEYLDSGMVSSLSFEWFFPISRMRRISLSKLDDMRLMLDVIFWKVWATSSQFPFQTGSDMDDVKLVEYFEIFKEKMRDMEYRVSIDFTNEEWDETTECYEWWKKLKNCHNDLFDCRHTTLNAYFPKVCNFYMTRRQMQKSDVFDIQWEYIDSWWNNCILILAIAAVLDPRFKMDIVECWYERIYSDVIERASHVRRVEDEVALIYNDYAEANDCSKRSTSSGCHKMLDRWGMPCTSSHHVDDAVSTQSELDRYFEDVRYPAVEEFEILAWWRDNSKIYPTLGKMARDILSIPISGWDGLGTSFANDLFNVWRTCNLDKDTRDALVCTKIWLYDSFLSE